MTFLSLMEGRYDAFWRNTYVCVCAHAHFVNILCIFTLCSFFYFTIGLGMKNKMMTTPYAHDFRAGDYVKMIAGKYQGRIGCVAKPTRLMAWIVFKDGVDHLRVCLLHQHMEKCNPPPRDDQSTLEDESLTYETHDAFVPMARFLELEQRVERLDARSVELEAALEIQLGVVKETLVECITEAVDSLKLKTPWQEEQG